MSTPMVFAVHHVTCSNGSMDFNTRLKQLRHDAKLTQQELADALGYSAQSRIGNWEIGTKKPPFDELPRLAAALGVSVGALFGEESQSVRLDPDIVRDVAQALQNAFVAELGLGYSIIEHPDLFAGFYERIAHKEAGIDSPVVYTWLGRRLQELEARQGALDDDGHRASAAHRSNDPGKPGKTHTKASTTHR